MTAPNRPPSVDTLARSLSSSGLPHPICVDIAREAIEADDVDGAPARAEAFRRTLLTDVVNATGVLLHTNLGRAPLAHSQDAQAQTVEFDLSTGERGSRQTAVGQLFARLSRRRGCDGRQQQRRRGAARRSPRSPTAATCRSAVARASRSADRSASPR